MLCGNVSSKKYTATFYAVVNKMEDNMFSNHRSVDFMTISDVPP
jgi:hypothetical protein